MAHQYFKALIEADIGQADLVRRLEAGGLEFYNDGSGKVVIRTKESGDAYRALLARERHEERVARLREIERWGGPLPRSIFPELGS